MFLVFFLLCVRGCFCAWPKWSVIISRWVTVKLASFFAITTSRGFLLKSEMFPPLRDEWSPGAHSACRPFQREDTTQNQMMKLNEIACKGTYRDTRVHTRVFGQSLCRSVGVGRFFLSSMLMERWGWGIPLTLCTAGDTAAVMATAAATTASTGL